MPAAGLEVRAHVLEAVTVNSIGQEPSVQKMKEIGYRILEVWTLQQSIHLVSPSAPIQGRETPSPRPRPRQGDSDFIASLQNSSLRSAPRVFAIAGEHSQTE
ncbi:hypothetical protein SKAU_G00333430 [Synaphobranchus kaupii]|uniref:Uncharacterized protein n=1 Tax=Synaphobranchus kaupii TaxID=118154 RepID=A0A9Q1ELL9_SYNKA|nr:hypothetical protein SKAU_G00333430 [Synaphobranchus kaupii]